jgi:hypothetical protein
MLLPQFNKAEHAFPIRNVTCKHCGGRFSKRVPLTTQPKPGAELTGICARCSDPTKPRVGSNVKSLA